MDSMRCVRLSMPEAASAAASVVWSFASPLDPRSSASFSSDSSSAMASAASRISRASPTCPSVFTKSQILASTYCARRRSRASCPSVHGSAKSRPCILRTTWPISRVPFGQPVDPGDRSVDALGDRGYGVGDAPLAGGGRSRIGRLLKPCDGLFEPGDGLGKRAHCTARLMNLLVFLQRADVGRPRHVREELRPLRPRYLADIEVAVRVDRKPVRPEKRGRRGAGMRVAEARQQLTLMVDDADARTEVGAVAVDPHHRPELADITDRVPGVVHEQAAGPVQIVPLRLVFAVAVEHLDPVVLAIGDIDPTVRVAADVVDDVELTGIGAGLAPRHQQLAVRRVFVDAGVAVTVRDVDFALWRQRRVGAAVERLAAHIRRRLAWDAELQQHLAVFEPAFAHEMAAIVGQVDRLVPADMDAVRAGILSLAPGAQEITLAIEHHHRMVAAIEDVDIVLRIDANRADFLEGPAVRQFRPVLDDAVFEVAGADNDRHALSPFFGKVLSRSGRYRRPAR